MSEPHLQTLEERQAYGRSLRDKCSRSDHADWKLAKKRELLPLLLAAQNGRIPKLLAVKYQRMAVSPFGFYRGSVGIMAADLTHAPNSGIHAQICGDAHLLNFGSYAASDFSIVFDLNDFDETYFCPFEWDLKRLATSVFLAGREAQVADDVCHDAVLQFMSSYRHHMQQLSELGFREAYSYKVKHLADAQPIGDILDKAERATPQHLLQVLTASSTKRLPHFKHQEPVLTPVSHRTRSQLEAALRDYRRTLSPEQQILLDRYVPVDFAFKVVGTGSVALRDYVVLLLGNASESERTRDPLFLQIKQAVPSAYAGYLRPSHATWQHHGHRVVEGCRLMQSTSDPLLGWTTMESRDYLVRQLNDHKASVNPSEFAAPSALDSFSRVCGAVLARAHARTNDAAVLVGYCGEYKGNGKDDKLDRAMAKFAATYADQVTADYNQFRKLLRNGGLLRAKRGAAARS